MKLSLKLAQQDAEKRGKLETLLAKEDATDAEIKEADDLIGEVKSIVEQRKAAEQREAFAENNGSELEGLKSTPANPLPFGQQKSGEATFEGKDGEVVIDKKSRQIVEESGAKFTDKILNAIGTKAYADAFWKGLRKGVHSLSSGEIKTLSEGADGDGGTTVPVQFLAKLIEKKATPTRLAERVSRFQTNSDKLEIPRIVYGDDDLYTTGMRVTWSGETTTDSEHAVTDPDFGNVTIPIHKATMSMDVTEDLLSDSAFNLQSWIVNKFTETKDLVYDNMILNGDGRGKPAGILLNPSGTDQPAIVVTGSAAAVTADGLVDQAYAVPEQYDENCAWVFNKTATGRAIAKLKDSSNRYLFGKGSNDDGIASARPKELLGYPYLYSGFMPSPGANTYPTIFGDLRGYYFVERMMFSIMILNELKALQGKKVIYGRVRVGGQVGEPWRLKIGKCST
jgi:HK97 family phage major capsid protein